MNIVGKIFGYHASLEGDLYKLINPLERFSFENGFMVDEKIYFLNNQEEEKEKHFDESYNQEEDNHVKPNNHKINIFNHPVDKRIIRIIKENEDELIATVDMSRYKTKDGMFKDKINLTSHDEQTFYEILKALKKYTHVKKNPLNLWGYRAQIKRIDPDKVRKVLKNHNFKETSYFERLIKLNYDVPSWDKETPRRSVEIKAKRFDDRVDVKVGKHDTSIRSNNPNLLVSLLREFEQPANF